MFATFSDLWPRQAPFALCVTHDVDHLARHFYQSLWRCRRDGLLGLRREITSRLLHRNNPSWNFERLIKFEDGVGLRSTFFFMDETATGFGPQYWGRYRVKQPNVSAIMRELDRGGWEIGLHGSLFSYNQLALLKREKDELEQQLGKPVISTRQHYLHFQKDMTLSIHEQCGLEADSTFGSAQEPYAGQYGFFPFFPENSSIVEIPISIMDTVCPEEKSVRHKCEQLVEQIANLGGLIMLDWHQCICNENLFPERFSLLRDIISFAKNRGAWFAPMGEIASFWKKRFQASPSAEFSNDKTGNN